MFLQYLISSSDVTVKGTVTIKAGMKEHKMTTRRFQSMESRCRVVFLCSFITVALFLSFSQFHLYLKLSFAKKNNLASPLLGSF